MRPTRRSHEQQLHAVELPRLRPHASATTTTCRPRRSTRSRTSDGVRQRGRDSAALRQPVVVQPRHRLYADAERHVHQDGAAVGHGPYELHVPRPLHLLGSPAAMTARACSPRGTSSRSSPPRPSAGRSATSRSCEGSPHLGPQAPLELRPRRQQRDRRIPDARSPRTAPDVRERHELP